MIGALIGGLIGLLLLHNIFGVLIGGLLGYMVEQGRHQARFHRQASDSYVGPLFAVLGAVAKADGRVSAAEIAIAERLMQRMGLGPDQRAHAIASFNTGKRTGFDPSAAMARLRLWCGGRRDYAFPILDVVVETVLAEGASEAKMNLLRQLARELRISEMELMAILAMKGYTGTAGGPRGGWSAGGWRQHAPPSGAAIGPDPYAVLGVSRDADDREIKRAYRKLISEHHPDRLGNLPEDLRRRAEQRASEINSAYDRIKAERGMR